MDTLSHNAILACKLLREENRLYRKERSLITTENAKLKSQIDMASVKPTENTSQLPGNLLNEMKDHFLT